MMPGQSKKCIEAVLHLHNKITGFVQTLMMPAEDEGGLSMTHAQRMKASPAAWKSLADSHATATATTATVAYPVLQHVSGLSVQDEDEQTVSWCTQQRAANVQCSKSR